jgi:hypothetical protein
MLKLPGRLRPYGAPELNSVKTRAALAVSMLTFLSAGRQLGMAVIP